MGIYRAVWLQIERAVSDNLKAVPSGEGGIRRMTDEEIILRIALFCNALLIHHYRGPPSLLGKDYKV